MATTKTATRAPADTPENPPGHGTETAAATPGTATGANTRPAPNQIGGAVWYALRDHPGATPATLAAGAGVGKATARRALNDLEKAGYAARTPGGRAGGKRTADTWHATPDNDTIAATDAATDVGTPETAPVATGETPAPQAPEQPSDETPDTTGDMAPGDDTDSADASGETDQPTGDRDGPTGDRDGPDGDGDEAAEAMDAAALAEAREALSALATVINSVASALDAGDRAAALEAAEVIYGDSAKMRRLIKTAAMPRPRSGSGKPRSHPGELRAKVAAHLAANPGLQLTPHEVGKAIGHSAGAVANALDKLTETGQAVLTCERPRRYITADITALTPVTEAAPGAESAAATA